MLLDDLEKIHYGRNNLNDPPPTEQQAIDQGWTKLPDYQSVYHQIGKGNETNSKYVSPDGKMEGVYDKEGRLVTDPVNAGTYNFEPPTNSSGHTKLDVLPYYILGNSPRDTTTIEDRVIWANLRAGAVWLWDKITN